MAIAGRPPEVSWTGVTRVAARSLVTRRTAQGVMRERRERCPPGGIMLHARPECAVPDGAAALILRISWAVRANAGKSVPAWVSPEGTVPLSEHERRQFEQIEAALRDGDQIGRA